MSALAAAVAKLSRPVSVTIRGELEYDGTSPRPTAPAEETVYTVRLAIQRDGSGTMLSRTSEGDGTKTKARVWVSDAALTAVELESLPVAPPEDGEGPPGALIDWTDGRRYEVTAVLGWDVTFVGNGSGDPAFQRYACEERGPTPA
jgi:hypothetical protein